MRKERCHAEDRRAEASAPGERGVIIRTCRGGAACQSTPPYAAILRRSIDARDGVTFIYTVSAAIENEERVLRRARNKSVSVYAPAFYELPPMIAPPAVRPVVIGAGPAGLFTALVLARCGARPILLERGECVERRRRDVERFWATGELNEHSNVQFGEGGAGTFSDGKLNTGTKDVRHRYILEEFAAFGASEDILIDAKPHIGTDRLYTVFAESAAGAAFPSAREVRFNHQVTGLERRDGRLAALRVTSPTERIRAPRGARGARGRSQRATPSPCCAARASRWSRSPLPWACASSTARAIWTRSSIQYAGHPLAAADLVSLSAHTAVGRGVFSFCVCPGGQVVAAASEAGRVVTNGMSELARDGENINGGLLVSVTPEDFGGTDVLAGVAFQRRLEEAAYALGGGGYAAPAQTVGDFLAHRPSIGPGRVIFVAGILVAIQLGDSCRGNRRGRLDCSL